MRVEYQGKLIQIDCTMCGEDAEYIAEETNEPLCKRCALINADIKLQYPHKQKYKTREITPSDIPAILEILNKLKEINI